MNEHTDRVQEVYNRYVSLYELSGKCLTITELAYKNWVILSAKDGDWTLLRLGDNDGIMYICGRPPEYVSGYDLREAGLITFEEYKEEKEHNARFWQECQRESELRTLERLRNKYEGL